LFRPVVAVSGVGVRVEAQLVAEESDAHLEPISWISFCRNFREKKLKKVIPKLKSSTVSTFTLPKVKSSTVKVYVRN
jgi:hypothetical protein